MCRAEACPASIFFSRCGPHKKNGKNVEMMGHQSSAGGLLILKSTRPDSIYIIQNNSCQFEIFSTKGNLTFYDFEPSLTKVSLN